MRRAPGWTRLAGIALELTALAFMGYVLLRPEGDARSPSRPQRPSTPQHDDAGAPSDVAQTFAEPMDFITESADEGARYYRTADDDVEVLAGFYSDGRVRLADAQNRRFAGMLQAGHADMLELDSNQWSELFVRVTPAGRVQLELRGGPYDARVLTCETLRQSQDDRVV